jgi:hypothetical protein
VPAQPPDDHHGEIPEREVIGIQVEFRAREPRSFPEGRVPFRDLVPTREHDLRIAVRRQEVAHLPDHLRGLAAVRPDVLSGDVRDELLVAIRLGIEDDGGLTPVQLRPERLRPRKIPSSSGMLNLGSCVAASSSVREMSWMARRHSRMIVVIFSIRTWLLSSTSSEARGKNPHS